MRLPRMRSGLNFTNAKIYASIFLLRTITGVRAAVDKRNKDGVPLLTPNKRDYCITPPFFQFQPQAQILTRQRTLAD